MLLPIKASPPENPTTGHATSAPKNPYIFYKFFASTIISGLLWILTYYIITNILMNNYEKYVNYNEVEQNFTFVSQEVEDRILLKSLEKF